MQAVAQGHLKNPCTDVTPAPSASSGRARSRSSRSSASCRCCLLGATARRCCSASNEWWTCRRCYQIYAHTAPDLNTTRLATAPLLHTHTLPYHNSPSPLSWSLRTPAPRPLPVSLRRSCVCMCVYVSVREGVCVCVSVPVRLATPHREEPVLNTRVQLGYLLCEVVQQDESYYYT